MNGIGFAHFATRNPEAPALVDAENRVWSRGELYSLVNRLSRALRASGLGKGDILALMAPNSPEFVALYLAATQIGLYVVPVNWHLAPPEIAYIFGDSGAAALFVHERFTGVVQKILSGATIPARVRISSRAVPGFQSLEEFIESQPDSPLEDCVAGRVMMYTSATTGRPKAIELPIDDSAQALRRTIELHVAVGIALEHGHVHLCASMLYHGAPLDGAIVALHMGHTVVLVDRWQPERLLQLIEAHRVTTTVMVPTMFVRMLKLTEEVRRKYSTASLRRVVHTGAPCPPEVKRRMIEWWGPVLWDTYGAAEGAGTIGSSDEWSRYPGTVGRAIPGTELKILNDAGEEVPRGEPGTIYLSRFTGDQFRYRGDLEKTRACHRGSLFTVGDIGYMNDEGYLFLCDRKIDLILSGGTNIYPAEVERVLVLYPDVADCAVVGVPDETLGERVKAFVQLLPGITPGNALRADIMAFLAQQLASAKLPRQIEFVEKLPRTDAGKLYKRLLREAEPYVGIGIP